MLCHAQRSEASLASYRCFAPLSMTVPALVVKFHHLRWARSIGLYGCFPLPGYFICFVVLPVLASSNRLPSTPMEGKSCACAWVVIGRPQSLMKPRAAL